MEEVRGVVIYYTIDDKEQEGSNLLAPECLLSYDANGSEVLN